MISTTYRFANAADAPAIAALIERCYRGDYATTGWTSEAHLLKGPRTSETEVAALIADPEARFVVAEQDGQRLVACALIEKRGSNAYFGMLSIDPAAQGGGLGKAMIAEIENSARILWHSNAMTMVVISLREALIAWYGRRGYALTGKTLPFPFSATTGETRRDFHLVELSRPL